MPSVHRLHQLLVRLLFAQDSCAVPTVCTQRARCLRLCTARVAFACAKSTKLTVVGEPRSQQAEG